MCEPDTRSAAATRVQMALKSLGITSANVKEMPESTRTAKDAASAIGCKVAEIAKSLVFRTVESNRPILIIASGVNRVNEGEFARTLGERIERASPEFVREKTGFVIGGVAPVAHSEPIQTWMDASLFGFERIWAAAGTPNAVFEIAPAELKRITDASIVTL